MICDVDEGTSPHLQQDGQESVEVRSVRYRFSHGHLFNTEESIVSYAGAGASCVVLGTNWLKNLVRVTAK